MHVEILLRCLCLLQGLRQLQIFPVHELLSTLSLQLWSTRLKEMMRFIRVSNKRNSQCYIKTRQDTFQKISTCTVFKEIKEPIPSRHPYLDFTHRKQIRYSVTDMIDALGVYLTLGDQEGRLIEAFKREIHLFS